MLTYVVAETPVPGAVYMRTGVCNLPLHTGNCPRWLFPRMVKLSKAISAVLIDEFGHEEFLRRLANPYWFQSLSCVIGYDWHSSGTTTTTLGALKEALNKENLGIYFAGGKGNTSRKTPQEIENTTFNLSTNKIEKLKYSSKMSAKVDTSLLQDGYQLYHHSFVFDESGNWAVIQQGMNEENGYARRYHWSSNNIIDFVNEPHDAICCDTKNTALDLTSKENNEIRKTSLDIINDNPIHIKNYFNKKIKNNNRTNSMNNNFNNIKNNYNKNLINNNFNIKRNFVQKTITEFNGTAKEFTMPRRHYIIDMNKRNFDMLKKAYDVQPRTYEELAAIKGIGPKTIRSLALISELIYGQEISWKDPVKYSFAHGGKDKIPHEIDKKHYDKSIETMENAIKDTKLGNKDKIKAIRRLNRLYQPIK